MANVNKANKSSGRNARKYAAHRALKCWIALFFLANFFIACDQPVPGPGGGPGTGPDPVSTVLAPAFEPGPPGTGTVAYISTVTLSTRTDEAMIRYTAGTDSAEDPSDPPDRHQRHALRE